MLKPKKRSRKAFRYTCSLFFVNSRFFFAMYHPGVICFAFSRSEILLFQVFSSGGADVIRVSKSQLVEEVPLGGLPENAMFLDVFFPLVSNLGHTQVYSIDQLYR